MVRDKKQFEESGDPVFLDKAIEKLDAARLTLDIIYKGAGSGDKNPGWEGWYLPGNRRPNNGFPTLEMLNAIEENLRSITIPNE